jgi:hypothetical protein
MDIDGDLIAYILYISTKSVYRYTDTCTCIELIIIDMLSFGKIIFFFRKRNIFTA